jgi:hypothetical protein
MVSVCQLVMGFGNPFMPGWTFPPAIQEIQRWNGFKDTGISPIARENGKSLYPALAGRVQTLQSRLIARQLATQFGS